MSDPRIQRPVKEPVRPTPGAGANGQGPDPLQVILEEIGALPRRLSRIIRLAGDRAQVKVRAILLSVVLGFAVLIVFVAMAVAAGIFIVRGASGGFAALFGDRAWAGQLAAGVLVLGALVATVTMLLQAYDRRRLRRKVQEYALRKSAD